MALELGCLWVLGGALRLEHLGFWFWVSFEYNGSKSTSLPSGQGWFHPKPAGCGPNPHPGSGDWGEHRAPAGNKVWVGQMGVQDHLPSCSHSHEKTFNSCQLVLKRTSGASSVPQFPLSHPRLVPRILTGPPAQSAPAATREAGLDPLPMGSCWAGRTSAGMWDWEGPAPWDRRSLLQGLTGRIVPSALGRGEQSGAAHPAPPGRHHGAAVGAAGAGWDGRSCRPG